MIRVRGRRYGMRKRDVRLQMFDAMRQPVMLIGRSYDVVDANSAACAMVNRTLENVVGRRCYKLSHDLDAPCSESLDLTCPVMTAFEIRQRVTAIHKHVHAGKVKFEEITATPLADRRGRVEYVLKELRDVTELVYAKEISEHLKQEIRTLRGIIPICASCKRVRNGDGYWQQVEAYVSEHTGVDFTHGYCPECAERLKKEIHAFKPRNGKAEKV